MIRAHPTLFIPRDGDGQVPICGPRASLPAWVGWWALGAPAPSPAWGSVVAGVGANLWSAGIPARMGGVVECCDVDGAFMGENPHPLRVAPIATGDGSDSAPIRRFSFHAMTMGRRGRRRSQGDAPPLPVNPLVGG